MNINIERVIRNEGYTGAEMSCGKHSLSVCFSKNAAGQYCNVIVNNASHRAFRMSGKFFKSVSEAVESYKQPEIKAMLTAFNDEIISDNWTATGASSAFLM